jgi:tetratricopeptide (TPR) repeat protein
VLDLLFVCLLLYLVSGAAVAGSDGPGRSWRWLGIGATLGALGLTRENALLFVPVLVGWIWLSTSGTERVGGGAVRRSRSKSTIEDRAPFSTTGKGVRTAALIAGVGIVLLPVGFRNLIVGGEFHLTTTQSGPNFFIGNNPQADGTYMPLRFGRGSPEFERQDATELAAKAAGRSLSPGEVSSYWIGRGIDFIRMRPAEWIALEGRKLWLLSNVTEVLDTESQESHEDDSLPLRLLAHVANFGVLLPLALLGMWLTWSERRMLWVFYALMGAYVVSLLAFYVVARYRLPLVPFLILFAAAGVIRAVEKGRRTWGRTPVSYPAATTGDTNGSNHPAVWNLPPFLLLAAITFVCHWPAMSADSMRVVAYLNLGTAWQEAGRLDQAATAFSHALSIAPDYAPAHNGLGSVLRQSGRTHDAVRHLVDALRLRPDFDDARFNLANALSDDGRLDEAIEQYQALLPRRADAVDVHSNLAIALANRGRLDEAIDHFRSAATLGPGSAKAHYNFGHALLSQGNLDAATAELMRAVTLDPADPQLHYELGSAYLAQQRLSEAVEQFRETTRLAPRLGAGFNNLGIALGSLGRIDEAIAAFRQALQVDPGSTEAQANLTSALAVRRGTK